MRRLIHYIRQARRGFSEKDKTAGRGSGNGPDATWGAHFLLV